MCETNDFSVKYVEQNFEQKFLHVSTFCSARLTEKFCRLAHFFSVDDACSLFKSLMSFEMNRTSQYY